MAFGFSDKSSQTILSGFFSNKCMAFRLRDKNPQWIFSGFFSSNGMAFGFSDNESHHMLFAYRGFTTGKYFGDCMFGY